MRAASVFAMVASLLVFTGCSTTGGLPCGGGGGCNGYQTGSPAGLFGGGGGGCDSGGCSSGACDSGFGSGNSGTSASFSDIDCGPMCGAYLQSGQVASGGCGCNDCQMGRSYLGGHVDNLRSALQSRPLAGAFAGPCRGLGATVGCIGCGECGGSAIGLNHSDTSGPFAGGGGVGFGGGAGFGGGVGGGCGCGRPGCGGRCGKGGGGLKGLLSGKSWHPYGGEVPHTSTAQGPAAGGGPGGGVPAYAYPYYTTRGPRDFLMSNPPTIGR